MENDGKVDKGNNLYTSCHCCTQKNIEEAKKSWSIGAENVTNIYKYKRNKTDSIKQNYHVGTSISDSGNMK